MRKFDGLHRAGRTAVAFGAGIDATVHQGVSPRGEEPEAFLLSGNVWVTLQAHKRGNH